MIEKALNAPTPPPRTSARTSAPASTRARGRPQAGDSDDIRQNIIDTAVELFARQGYKATSIRQIAERVGVNGAMIHYYFGSKESLLQETLEVITAPLAAALLKMKQQGHAPLDEIVSVLYETFRQHPDIPVLMTREVLLPGGVAQGVFVERLASRLGGALPGLLAAEQEAGRIDGKIDPSIGALHLMSLCAFPFISRSISQPALGLTFDDEGIDRLREQTISLLQNGVQS